ncbi:hypothetical protein IL306_000328 [Fusarium sp. DS 682]|nr:hypothetical protein IL306_000328 [Fusarium sp. DS 682]
MPPLKPLLDCEGPKLEPFEHDLEADDVEFLKILELEEDQCTHSTIVKTKIGDKIYAIKFFIWGEDNYLKHPYTEVYGDNENLHMRCCRGFDYYFTPFESECRAFGRLKEVGREDLAVKVHGYVAIRLTDIIRQKLQAAWARMSDPPKKLEWIFEMGDGNPTMGIVKDLVEEVEYDDLDNIDLYREVVQVRHFPRMLEGVHDLHKHGIVVRDLYHKQYVNGTLIDLSFASTVPHPFGPDPDPLGSGKCWQPRWTFQSLAAYDLYCFQKRVIKVWHEDLSTFMKSKPGTKGIKKTCWLRAYGLSSHTRSLRPRDGRYSNQEQRPYLPILNHLDEALDMTQVPRYDPLDFVKHTPVTKTVTKRETRRATGQGVRKRVAKGKR